MMFKIILFICLNACLLNGEKVDLSRGLGEEINWLPLDEALIEAKNVMKPIFLLIHKSWCGACKTLKPVLNESQKFKELSKQFVMVNALDDEEPSDRVYAPDGGYIPRILYLTHLGEVKTDLYNEYGNPKYKYFYMSAETITLSMEKALSELSVNVNDMKNETSSNEDENEKNEPILKDYEELSKNNDGKQNHNEKQDL